MHTTGGNLYTDVNDLEVTTLDDVLYFSMKNDVSFLIRETMNLYEHQSTVNPNMPLRGLLYFADLYKGLLKDSNPYSTKLLKLPTPIYVVFYNGNKDIGEEQYLKLSDAFEHGNEQSHMELYAQVLNINYGHQAELMSKCTILDEYSSFIGKIKEYQKDMSFEVAVNKAIDACIKEDILRDFLKKRRAEVMSSFLTEYDEEKVLAGIGREKFEEGLEVGLKNFILDNIEENVPMERILSKLEKRFQLSPEKAREYYDRFSK